MLPYKQRQVN